jgi:sodium bicarbonate transporter 10
MGISSLDGIQMFDRMLLFIMPKKYQPDYPFLRAIPTSRVHLFTILQVAGPFEVCADFFPMK